MPVIPKGVPAIKIKATADAAEIAEIAEVVSVATSTTPEPLETADGHSRDLQETVDVTITSADVDGAWQAALVTAMNAKTDVYFEAERNDALPATGVIAIGGPQQVGANGGNNGSGRVMRVQNRPPTESEGARCEVMIRVIRPAGGPVTEVPV